MAGSGRCKIPRPYQARIDAPGRPSKERERGRAGRRTAPSLLGRPVETPLPPRILHLGPSSPPSVSRQCCYRDSAALLSFQTSSPPPVTSRRIAAAAAQASNGSPSSFCPVARRPRTRSGSPIACCAHRQATSNQLLTDHPESKVRISAYIQASPKTILSHARSLCPRCSSPSAQVQEALSPSIDPHNPPCSHYPPPRQISHLSKACATRPLTLQAAGGFVQPKVIGFSGLRTHSFVGKR